MRLYVWPCVVNNSISNDNIDILEPNDDMLLVWYKIICIIMYSIYVCNCNPIICNSINMFNIDIVSISNMYLCKYGSMCRSWSY
jgi:hypothetical protein